MLPLFESAKNHRLDPPQSGIAQPVRLRTAAAGPIFTHRLSTANRNLIAFFSYRAS